MNDKKIVKIDGRTKDEIIRDLRRELAEVRREHAARWDLLSPQLPDEMRTRSKIVWESALYAHLNAQKGEPGPRAVIAAALRDAEKQGPRAQKGGVMDPVAFIADRIQSIAQANDKDPMDLFQAIANRFAPEGPKEGENDGGPEDEG